VEILKGTISRFFISLFIVASIGAILWGYFGISFYIETGMFAIIIGFLCGLVSSIFYAKKFGWVYLNGSLFFSFYGIFLGKYIVYAHLYESSYFLTDQSKFLIVFKLISQFSLSKFLRFRDFFNDTSSFIDLVWFLVAIIAVISTTLNFRRHKIYISRLAIKWRWIGRWLP